MTVDGHDRVVGGGRSVSNLSALFSGLEWRTEWDFNHVGMTGCSPGSATASSYVPQAILELFIHCNILPTAN